MTLPETAKALAQSAYYYEESLEAKILEALRAVREEDADIIMNAVVTGPYKKELLNLLIPISEAIRAKAGER